MHKVREGAAIAQVDLSVPTILPSRVRVPSTPSTLLSFIEFVVYLSCEKNEKRKKRAELAHFKRQSEKQVNNQIEDERWRGIKRN